MKGVKIAVLWRNESKKGQTYLAGNLGPTARLLVFPNEYKKAENDPDYSVLLVPREKKNGDQEEQDVPL